MKNLTVWFGKEISMEEVTKTVKRLRGKGYFVEAPFYIGYCVNHDMVLSYLRTSLDRSDGLLLIGREGNLLKDIEKYARITNKPVLEERKCSYSVI